LTRHLPRVALGVAGTALAVGTLLAATLDDRTPAAIVFGIAWVASIAGCTAKAVTDPSARAPWTLFAIGLAGQGWSSIAYFVNASAAAGFPSGDDFALLFYPTTVVATVLLVRRRLASMPRALWLDAAIGGAALAAVGSVWIGERLLDLPGNDGIGALVYTILDLALTGLMIVACAFAGRGRLYALYALVASWMLTSLGDSIFALSFTHGEPVPISAAIAWTAGGVLIAAAAASENPQPRESTEPRWALVTVPVIAALVAIAIPLADPDCTLAVVLSSLTLVLVVARLAISLIDNQHAEEDRVRDAETRRARVEADRANRAKTEFLSRMSHEVRTPLNSILGFAQLLVDDLEGPDRDSVERILRAGNHLRRLIDDVLDLSAIEAGQTAITLEPVDLGWAIEESIALLEPLAQKRGARVVRRDASNAPPFVRADPQRLKQVLLNLISNAIKYGGERPEVVVRAERRGERAHVSVLDSGPGVAADQVEKLWLPFERGVAKGSGIEGSGLGLALTHNLVDAMGGTIGVKTASEGGAFWFTLPITDASPLDLAAGSPRTATPAAESPTTTVLYIEDQPTNLELMQQLMERRGDVLLETATTGRDGLARALELQPDLVLLDLDLPDIQGEEVLAALRADDDLGSVPVIVVSADATAWRQEQLREGGATAYVVKPLQLAAFLQTFDRVMSAQEKGRSPFLH
jgi:signal transduction histidine kinase/ActR/RegA family two-component response regulator